MLNIFAHNVKVALMNYDVHGDKTNESGCLKAHLDELFKYYPMLRCYRVSSRKMGGTAFVGQKMVRNKL